MKKLFIAFALIGFIFLFAQFVIMKNTSTTEKPNFQVIEHFDGFEIRAYENMHVVSSTLNTTQYDETSRNGFRILAGYIFGNNKEEKKIAMTSPVIMEMGDSVTMSFILPKSLTVESAPLPNDERVDLQERPKEILAVLEFGGWASDEKIQKKTRELKKLLSEKNIPFFGDPIYMGYNPPYQLIGRKNEVALRVKYN